MKILIIQEKGRHKANEKFRESLCIKRGLISQGIEAEVWGLNYDTFKIPFNDISKDYDVLFIIENYLTDWLPITEIANSDKLKIFWSIDSHCILSQHIQLCKTLKIDVLLNSTETYLKDFNVNEKYWFPNAYPDELIFPKQEITKSIDIGFCGNINNRGEWINHLDKYKIKKDVFVIGEDMVDCINSYKIHFNRNISNDINYRTFETLGCGTFLLTNYTPNLEKLFVIGEELITYQNKDDLDVKVNFYLNTPHEVYRIAQNGLKRVLKDHTYKERCKQLLEIINKHLTFNQ